jgi:ribose transport system permease protein
MNAGLRRWAPRGRDLYPVAVLVLAVVGLLVIAPLAGSTVGVANVYNILQIVADYGLVALALGLTMLLGEYDISTAGVYAVGGVVAVTLGQSSPVLGIAAAVVVGLLSGAVQGGAIAGFRMSSVPVTLGGYLALVGLAHVVAHDKTVPYANYRVGLALDSPLLGIFSLRSIVVLVAFVVTAVVLRHTTLGPGMRAVGGDRRGARTAGVPVRRTLLATMVVSGALAALGGGMSAYSLASANPEIGIAPLLFATIAVLLGGVALSGGRGSAWGILAGVATYATLHEMLAILGTPDWLGDLVTGGLLTVVTVCTAPDLVRILVTARSRWRSTRALPTIAGDAVRP